MRDRPVPMTIEQAAARRKGVRTTLLVFACIAAAIYIGYILFGVLR